MSPTLWLSFAVAFLASLLMTAVLVPVMKRAAVYWGVLDHPGGYKQQAEPIPYLGGVAMAASSVIGVVALWQMGLAATWREGVIIVCAGIAMMLVGLVDDVRGLSPWTRLVAQAAAAGVVIASGTAIEIFDAAALGAVFTLLWIVGITNALNLLDNMDGLATGVAAISSGWIFVIAVTNGQFLVAAMVAGVLGASLGFLRFNHHPASIYMGDAGSLFLGFLLAVAGIRLRFDDPVRYTWLIPVVALGVPILDTSFVTVTRLRRGASPLSGGRDHISHRLVALGMSVRGAVGFLGLAAFAFGLIAFVISRNADWTAYVLAGGAFGSGLVGLWWLERRTSSIVEIPRIELGPMGEETA